MTAVSSSAHAVLISGRAARARTLTLKDGRVVASRVIERGCSFRLQRFVRGLSDSSRRRVLFQIRNGAPCDSSCRLAVPGTY